MRLVLFGHPFFEGFQKFFQTAQGFDLGHFFGAHHPLGDLAQPVFGNFIQQAFFGAPLQSLEAGAEHAIELVQIALVLDQTGTAQEIEIIDVIIGDALFHALNQGQIFPERYRNIGLFKG